MSKLEAIKTATASGVECVIANGRTKNILINIIEGKSVGTHFKTSGARLMAKKRWIAFSSKPKGTILVDSGAKIALSNNFKSLLASGIFSVEGAFEAGDVVRVSDKNMKEFARGLANYSSSEIMKIKGLKTAQLKDALGYKGQDEVIHKDNLVIL